jgi:hypothetical protein
MSWETCCSKSLIKKVIPDAGLVKSLIASAENKIITTSMLVPSTITISSIISLLYDAARELLESLASIKGYKIYNHDCYFAFIKREFDNEKMSGIFNNSRLIRNGINYYGVHVSLEKGELIVRDINELIIFIKQKTQSEFNNEKL